MSPTQRAKPQCPAERDGLIAELISTLTLSPEVRNAAHNQPLTLVDVIRTGAVFCKVLAELSPKTGGRFSEQDLQFVSGILASNSREELTELILSRIETGSENTADFHSVRTRVQQLMDESFKPRQFLIGLIREIVPAGSPGRKRKITDDDLANLRKRSEQLQPAIKSLLQISQASRKRSLVDHIEYIKPDYPDACDYLLQHTKTVETVFGDKRLLAQVKTPETRVRLVADAIAGAEYDISPRYSIDRTRQARRAKQRKGRTPS